MVWGLAPLISVPCVTLGVNNSAFEVLDSVTCGLTILPASFLGLNAVLLLAAVCRFFKANHRVGVGTTISIAVSMLLAGCLAYMESSHWPTAIDRRGNVAAESR